MDDIGSELSLYKKKIVSIIISIVIQNQNNFSWTENHNPNIKI